MGFKCGIVGLPNVGKSTLFNALTETAAAQAANYPFCTIEPNVGEVAVPDPRLETLAKLAKSAEIVPTRLTFVDIAGLVKGASQGEGLGNQFLQNIREVDAVAHVVRCFDDPDIAHVLGAVDPARDREIINLELALSDLQIVERRLQKVERTARTGEKDAVLELGLLNRLIRAGYHLLDLISFFTAGEKEVRAWTIRRGSRAPQAAGEIHSDFERGFIRAETLAWNDFVATGDQKVAREKGLVRSEGKEY